MAATPDTAPSPADPRADGLSAPLLVMRGISKSFPGVRALKGVDLDVRAGEILGLVGENGAGKSTLMKILSGVYPHGDYEGEIRLDGEEVRFRGIRDSERAGVIIIHQELALVPLLSIAENVFLGHEPARGGVIDWGRAQSRTRELLARVGLNQPPTALVGALGAGQQQLVEIAKALAKEVRLLILDEPTASLNERDSDALLALLLQLRDRGVASVLITHKLNEVAKVADRITVLRDGATVATLPREDGAGESGFREDAIIRHMVGRDLTDRYPPRARGPGEPLLEVANWVAHHPSQPGRRVVDDVSITVRRGEVVGIAGLMGAGRTEFAMSLFGRSFGRRISGTVRMKGREVDVSTVPKALAAGIAYVTEDRKTLGLLLEESIRSNVSLVNLKGVSKRGVIDELKELAVADRFRERLGIRSASASQVAGQLSGGNQQKVVLAKWLFADPDLLILDEPTRGIDVGAKYEIYKVINRLAEEGRGVLVISSEMPEVLGLADRIYVMNEGRIVAEMAANEADPEKIMTAIVRHGRRNGRAEPARA